MMPIETIPDWEKRPARQNAFWSRGIIDRPVVSITIPRPRPERQWPEAHHASTSAPTNSIASWRT